MSSKNSAASEEDLNKVSGGKVYYNSYTKKWEVYHDETGAPAGEYDTEYEALKADASLNNRLLTAKERNEYMEKFNNL